MAKMAAFATKLRAHARRIDPRRMSRPATPACPAATGDERRPASAHASAASMSGTRTWKTERQPNASTSRPAGSGPSAKPSPIAAPRNPSRRPRSAAGAPRVARAGAVP